MIDERIDPGPPFTITPGRSHPLGATVGADGVNFSVYSEHAVWIELLLFEDPTDPKPVHVVPLGREEHNTAHFWHAHVAGARAGMGYAYRVHGPQGEGALPGRGDRFNSDVVLLDPYARAVETRLWDRAAACLGYDNLDTSLRGIIVDLADYDWAGDTPPNRPMAASVIYELHVGGFTRGPDAGVTAPGTFRGLIQKIPYLTRLGVTAVELLPVLQFDPTDVDRANPETGEPLSNYWGYSTVGFFAPHAGYCTDAAQAVREFRDLVKALHAAGIEVILDVDFDHTSEGGESGPTISFKGLDDAVYYRDDPAGRGNSLDADHPVVEKLILDCLTFWVRDMHVDGFRFDEGSLLTRARAGAAPAQPPVISHIELSEDLLDAKVIAEAWDAAGEHPVGYFPGHRWAERNGRYRDAVRRFVAGTPGILAEVANRLAGSADLFRAHDRVPANGVNFVTGHDGLTAADLVTYSAKRNQGNGEDGRDGVTEDLAWNCGVEGPSDDAQVRALRARQVKNLTALLLVSQGVPMLGMGDEVHRSQGGNNNAYCQDNPVSWFDWQGPLHHPDTLRFVQRMVGLRRAQPGLQRARFFDGLVSGRGLADLTWHGTRLGDPGWDDPAGRALAFTLGAAQDADPDLHVIANMAEQVLAFELPRVEGRRWLRAVDTFRPGGEDIADPGGEVPVQGDHYLANPHSVVVLISGQTP